MNQENKTEINIDINNLKDEEIKDMIIDMNREQLTIVRNMSYYYTIGRISERAYDFQKENILENTGMVKEKEIIQKSLNTIIESFCKYHLSLSEEEITEEEEVLTSTRKELYNLVNSLHGYGIELSYMKEILDYKTMKDLGKDKGYRITRNDIDYLINRTRAILDDETTNHNRYIKLISNIILLLPFRMSKLRYFEVLKDTLLRNLNRYPTYIVENKIEEYKMIFNSTLLGDYGILFDEYFTDIQRLKRRNINSIESKEKEDINTNINDLETNINKVKEFITDLGIIINKMLVLYLTKGKVEELKDDDIYSKFKNFIKSQNKESLEILLDISNNKLEEYEKKLLSKAEDFEKLVHESTRRGIDFEDVLNEEIRHTGEVLTYYNDMKLSKDEILFANNYEIIDRSYLEQLIDSLIQYINRSITSMNNVERKIRMRRLLSLIELPFNNIEEFLNYIEYSFDERVVSMEELLFTFFSLNHMLEGFKERH